MLVKQCLCPGNGLSAAQGSIADVLGIVLDDPDGSMPMQLQLWFLPSVDLLVHGLGYVKASNVVRMKQVTSQFETQLHANLLELDQDMDAYARSHPYEEDEEFHLPDSTPARSGLPGSTSPAPTSLAARYRKKARAILERPHVKEAAAAIMRPRNVAVPATSRKYDQCIAYIFILRCLEEGWKGLSFDQVASIFKALCLMIIERYCPSDEERLAVDVLIHWYLKGNRSYFDVTDTLAAALRAAYVPGPSFKVDILDVPSDSKESKGIEYRMSTIALELAPLVVSSTTGNSRRVYFLPRFCRGRMIACNRFSDMFQPRDGSPKPPSCVVVGTSRRSIGPLLFAPSAPESSLQLPMQSSMQLPRPQETSPMLHGSVLLAEMLASGAFTRAKANVGQYFNSEQTMSGRSIATQHFVAIALRRARMAPRPIALLSND